MSEALISKEHFYLNASQYNRTASDVTANIHVQDTQDILEQNADWLVHVTRFSCDAMNAIAYCEKDTSAYWEIRVLDDAMSIKETFNFVLDKDYATPQALVEAMNETGRMLLEGHGLVEAYRFQIGPSLAGERYYPATVLAYTVRRVGINERAVGFRASNTALY